MRKMRADSIWNQLTAEQAEKLEDWLFEENLGYEQALEKVRGEFGIEASVASLGRYSRRLARERQAGEMLDAQAAADAVNSLPLDTDGLRAAALKLAHKAALRLALENPDQVEQLTALLRLLLESEEMATRKGRLELAREEFQFQTIVAAQKELPQLRALMKTIKNDARLSTEEKSERVLDLLHGPDRAKPEPDPDPAGPEETSQGSAGKTEGEAA